MNEFFALYKAINKIQIIIGICEGINRSLQKYFPQLTEEQRYEAIVSYLEKIENKI